MKKLFLVSMLALASSTVFAQWSPMPPSHVFPTVRNYGSSVEIWVSNPNNHYVWCSGSLSMYMDGPDNRVHTASVSMNIYPRGYMNRSYRPASSGRIRNIRHSIYCR